MNSIIYLVGLVVVVMAILSFIGLAWAFFRPVQPPLFPELPQ